MSSYERAVARPVSSSLSSNKVIRNTYTLLSLTLLFSAFMAGIGMTLPVSYMVHLLTSVGALVLLWFVLPRTANSAAGLGVVFAITGLLGFGLGPVLSSYLSLPNGGQIVMTALGSTGLIFLGLSGYALMSRRDFSFMAGFLFAGLIMAVIGMLVVLVASLFGYYMPTFHLVISGLVALVMSGMILFETSRIVNGGETNYILATVSLYLSLYNLFVSLLHITGALSGDD